MSHDFFSLTPDATLDAVESALKGTEQASRATGRCWALNSVENRVYEIELENSTSIIAKFYRPGRWKRDQILEEHRFLSELDKAEVPVVPPLLLSSASTLCETDSHIFFSIFPKMRGKSRDELRPDQLELLGRFLARLHNVGEGFGRSKRLQLNVRSYGQDSLKFLENSGFIQISDIY